HVMAMGPDMMGGGMGPMPVDGGLSPGAPAPMAPATPPAPSATPDAQQNSGIIRTPPDIPESRRQGVAKLVNEVQLDKAHWQKDFGEMEAEMNFARGWQWIDQQGWEDERYIANIVQRHINQRVSALYAKNPTFVCKRKKRLDFQIWDGTPQMLQMAMQTMQQAATMAVDPAAGAQGMQMVASNPQVAQQAFQAVQQAQSVLQDVQQGLAKKKMFQGVADTLEIVFDYYVGEQALPFKTEMKQMVRRANTCGLAFIKLGFQ